MRSFSCLRSMVLAICVAMFFTGCAKPLAEGKLFEMEPVSRIINADPNTIYYGIKWAMDQCGYPSGLEDLESGVVESKWVPTAAGSHYVDTVAGADYGSNAAYYKIVAQIVPMEPGKSRVEVQTRVKSIVNNMKTKGVKERELLDKIQLYSRGTDIAVTNIGVQD